MEKKVATKKGYKVLQMDFRYEVNTKTFYKKKLLDPLPVTAQKCCLITDNVISIN